MGVGDATSTDLPPMSGICRRFIKTCRRVKSRAKIVKCELGIRSTGIKVYSLGINTDNSDQIVAVASISTLQ